MSFIDAIEQSGISTADIKRKTGISAQTISNWKKRGISRDGAIAISEAFKIPLNQLLSSNPRIGRVAIIDSDFLKRGMDVQEAITNSQATIAAAGDVDNAFALRVEGAAMEPRFQIGSFVIAEPGLEPRSGDYVIAATGDALLFRRAERVAGGWLLVAESPAIPPSMLGDGRIIGVVVQHIQKLR